MRLRRPNFSMMGGGLGTPSPPSDVGLGLSPMAGAAPGSSPPGAAPPLPPGPRQPGLPSPMGAAMSGGGPMMPGQKPPHLEAPMNPAAFQRAFLIRELLGGQSEMADPNQPNAGLPPGFTAPKPYPPPGPPTRRR